MTKQEIIEEAKNWETKIDKEFIDILMNEMTEEAIKEIDLVRLKILFYGISIGIAWGEEKYKT